MFVSIKRPKNYSFRMPSSLHVYKVLKDTESFDILWPEVIPQFASVYRTLGSITSLFSFENVARLMCSLIFRVK